MVITMVYLEAWDTLVRVAVEIVTHHNSDSGMCECCSELSDMVDCLSKQEFDSLTVKPVLERTMVHFLPHRQQPLPHVT